MGHLNIYQDVDKFLSTDVSQLKKAFGETGILEIKGQLDPPLFISILQHGNEHTGYTALKDFLKKNLNRQGLLPRGIHLFLGNLEAAAAGLRRLPQGLDYNRLWGEQDGRGDTYHLIQAVKDYILTKPHLAAIDIHNNTGRNPPYGCISHSRMENQLLASRFASRCLYFEEPSTAQTPSLQGELPAITLECGQSNEPYGLAAVARLLASLMKPEPFFHNGPFVSACVYYKNVARILLAEGARVGFSDINHPPQHHDVIFPDHFEEFNFQYLPRHFPLARLGAKGAGCLTGEVYEPGLGELLYEQDGMVRLNSPLIPIMLTTDPVILSQDCVGYFLKTIAFSEDSQSEGAPL